MAGVVRKVRPQDAPPGVDRKAWLTRKLQEIEKDLNDARAAKAYTAIAALSRHQLTFRNALDERETEPEPEDLSDVDPVTEVREAMRALPPELRAVALDVLTGGGK